MKKVSFVFISVFISCQVLSQHSKTFVVKAGENASKIIPRHEQLRFQEFQDGFLINPAGKRSPLLKLNYNLLFGEVQFINEKEDTAFVDNSGLYQYALIKQYLFQYDPQKGYFEILLTSEKVKLAAQHAWKFLRKEAVINNGYGEVSSSTADYSIRHSYSLAKMVHNDNVTYSKEVDYFLIDPKQNIYKANKKIILDIFSDHRTEVQKYIKQEDVDFNNEESLRKLLQFCAALKTNN